MSKEKTWLSLEMTLDFWVVADVKVAPAKFLYFYFIPSQAIFYISSEKRVQIDGAPLSIVII